MSITPVMICCSLLALLLAVTSSTGARQYIGTFGDASEVAASQYSPDSIASRLDELNSDEIVKRYMRFGRRSNMADAGEEAPLSYNAVDDDDQQPADSDDVIRDNKRYMRFGKRYMRFGKRYMRFGRSV